VKGYDGVEQVIRPKLNWQRALILTSLALVGGVTCLLLGLDSNGGAQIALLAGAAVAMFLFFAGIYVTLVRRYYYRQP
jgi:NADH:ubiquinone oxidoreductase subunit 6 (subunit J)